MHAHWSSLLPPLIVITLACITKRLNFSLLIGLATATLIATDGHPLSAFSLLIKRIIEQGMDFENACNYIFLFIISALIVLIGRTGGALAFAHRITQKINSVKAVETASLMVSSMLFIDDYLSNLTAGYSMRPLSDKFSIARVKLTYLVHSLSSPLVVISPVSSWIAMLTAQIENADISAPATENSKIIAEPFVIYVQSIPFMFYSFLLVASVWFVVRRRISYGPMHRYELIAQTTGNLFGGKQPPLNSITLQEKKEATSFDLLFPVGLLIGSVVTGFLYAGGFYLFGGTHGFISALQHNTQTPLVLLIAGSLTFIISCIVALLRHTINANELPAVVREGVLSIYSSVVMIFLAITLGVMLKVDLKTGVYLASLLQNSMPLWLLPCTLFLLSTAISFITGSSWGTIALMSPIGTQILVSLLDGTPPFVVATAPMILPVIGAIFAGAICGNHISPISDTTMLSSASCGSYPIDHIQTQFPYALPVIISTCVAFIVAGFLIHKGIWVAALSSLGVGLVLTLGTIWCVNRIARK